MIPQDAIQNELIIIQHHLKDIDEGLADNDINYVKNGLKDIKESVQRLAKLLTPPEQDEIARIAESISN
jgi:5-bromo-4-chloroindolyl phosphate hydrolysis protein